MLSPGRLAAAAQFVTALAALVTAAVAFAGQNRAAVLGPDALVAAGFAAAAGGLQIRQGTRAAFFFAAVAMVLLAWLPASAHFVETGIKAAAMPCPPFTGVCKPGPALTPDETATLQATTAVSIVATLVAAVAAASVIAAATQRQERAIPQAVLLAIAAIAAATAAYAPWLAGGPPYGFDDRAAFFTVFAELAALAAALGTVAAYRGAILAMLALGAATTIVTVAIAALLPFTTDLIGAVGQNLPLNCGGQPACELPPFNHTEDTARTLMQVAAAAGALAAAAATATGLRRQRFEDLV